jgi:Holliday junction resolvase RusA-like endonuclease
MIKVTLKWRPISTQSLYGDRAINKQGKRIVIKYMTKEWKARKKNYIKQAIEQYGWEPLEWYLVAKIVWYFPNHNTPDRDNRHKISMDALEWVIYKNDRQIKKVTWIEMYLDKINPRIELLIRKMTNEEILNLQARSGPMWQQALWF